MHIKYHNHDYILHKMPQCVYVKYCILVVYSNKLVIFDVIICYQGMGTFLKLFFFIHTCSSSLAKLNELFNLSCFW